MTAFASLLASTAASASVRADCVAARSGADISHLPGTWRAAIEALMRSTTEPGHPWSCAGGNILLELDARGAVLSVARAGESAVRRHIAAPEDVLPLGQALLAMPLTPSSEVADNAPPAPVPDIVASTPLPAAPLPTTVQGTSSKPSRRLLLSIGADGRAVLGSSVAWLGPTASAGLLMDRWLPSISLRQQSAIASERLAIDEVSVALAVQARFEISRFELRTGLALRGAAVQRDLSRKRGEQSRLEGRVGVLTSFAIPVLSWANLVFALDADVVALSRETAEPAASTGDLTPTPFPTYTLGGSVCLEVPL